jgi:hypothetical protein
LATLAVFQGGFQKQYILVLSVCMTESQLHKYGLCQTALSKGCTYARSRSR